MKQQSAPLSPRGEGQGEGLLEKYAQRDEDNEKYVRHDERRRESWSSEPEMAR